MQSLFLFLIIGFAFADVLNDCKDFGSDMNTIASKLGDKTFYISDAFRGKFDTYEAYITSIFTCYKSIFQNNYKRIYANDIDTVIKTTSCLKFDQQITGEPTFNSIKDFYLELEKLKHGNYIASSLVCKNVYELSFTFVESSKLYFTTSGLQQQEFFPTYFASLSTSTSLSLEVSNLEPYDLGYYCSTKQTNTESGCTSSYDSSANTLNCDCTPTMENNVAIVYTLGVPGKVTDNKTATIIVVIVLSIFGLIVLVGFLIFVITKVSLLSCWNDTTLTPEQNRTLLKDKE